MKAYLNYISYYLPEKVITNQNLADDFPRWSVEKITSKVGIKKRHVASEGEFSSDLGIKASEKLFAEYDIDRNSIDFILFCTQSPDYFLPTTACIIQNKLGLRTDIGALDFNLGCSGYVYGLSIAKGLILTGTAKNILLITAETYSKFINNQDKGNKTIFGDAAVACLISCEKKGLGGKILNFDLGTDGSGYDNLIVKGGGIRYKNIPKEMLKDTYGNERSNYNLYMNGPEIFNFTIERIPKMIENTLLKNNLTTEQINHFIFHQANQYMLNHLRKKLKITKDKFPIRMDFCGNTVSSTIPIVMKELEDETLIKKNDIALLAGFGVGYSWAGTIIKFEK
ncbi:MAG: 3-oxoacyl-ACP synthase III family protein [Flavobacteriales bacterium]